jgi:hypothetical protein
MNVLITIPKKISDPTEYTAQWAEKAVELARGYGYNVIVIRGKDVTYENVCAKLNKHHPRLFVHFGHGCPASLQGQTECCITRRFNIDELLNMNNLQEILMPLRYQSGCATSCLSTPDVCNPLCMNDTNINLLKDTIVVAVACYSALQLGKCAIKYGAAAYIGYDDLMLFPTDDVKSENLFRDVHLKFIELLLEGHTIQTCEEEMNKVEDALIKKYKKTKYVALPLLWNKIHRKVLGHKGESIYHAQ